MPLNKALLVLFLAIMPEHFVVCAQPIQDIQDGLEALKKQHYATALRILRPLAEQGDAQAQYNLGMMYGEGSGVAKDDVEAATWLRKAAVQGFAAAQNDLGVMYRDGRGVVKDEVQAVSWLHKAADSGNARSMSNLGFMYLYGLDSLSLQ